jgi:endoglucanase
MTASPEATSVPATQVAPTVIADDAAARAQRLGRGVNLGNALEAPQEGEWGMVIEARFFELIKDAGFATVRVPIRWSAHADPQPPYTVDPVFFERVDWVIAQALAQDLNVVVNMHHYDEIFVSPDAHADRFVAIWEQIARRYQGHPDTVYFEPLNEPHDALSSAAWNALLARTITAIREVDKRHTLIAGGDGWNSIAGLRSLAIPEGEKNLIATFHYYEPYLFTHQGAEWGGPEIGTLGVTWPGPPREKVDPLPAVKQIEWARLWFLRYNQNPGADNPASPGEISRAFDEALAWSDQRGIPLWLGEFGAYSTADMDSRVRWTATVREVAEARGIPWAYWEFGAGFGVYDRDQQVWRTPLLDALIP